MKRALAERVKQDMGDPIVPPSAPPSSSPMGFAGVNGVHGSGGAEHPPSKIPRLDPVPPVSASPQDLLPQTAVGGVGITSSSEIHAHMASKKRPRSPNVESSGNMTAYQSQKRPSHDADNNNGATSATKRGPGRPRKSASSSALKQENGSSDDDEADKSSFYLKRQNVSLAAELYAYRRRIYLLEREREFRRKECRSAERKIGELDGIWKGIESAIGKELEGNELLKEVGFFMCCYLLLFCIPLINTLFPFY